MSGGQIHSPTHIDMTTSSRSETEINAQDKSLLLILYNFKMSF